ncbi:MAG: hypothetical protein ABJA89_04425 [Lapillicoccus sp.]
MSRAPVPPASDAAVPEYIRAHRLVYVIELVCFVGLSIPALLVFQRLCCDALAHRQEPGPHRWAVGVGSEITALAVSSSPQSLYRGLLVLSDAYQDAAKPEERTGLSSAADAVAATTNAMPWAGVLTAAAISSSP